MSTSEVAPGDSYYYGLYIASPPPQPAGPGMPAPSPRFKVVFWGTKDGVDDIFAPGEALQGTLPAGNFWLNGYQNPSGPVAGTYTRYATILFNNEYDTHYCTTNTVTVTLD